MMNWVVPALVGISILFLVLYWRRRKSKPIGRAYTAEDEQSQFELDRYLSRNLSEAEIGRFYERQIGYRYESRGADVTYNGALQGLYDLGRDLIVKDGPDTFVIQAKCWSQRNIISPREIFELYGSVAYFKLLPSERGSKIKAVFYSTTGFSIPAQKAAHSLKVEMHQEPLDRNYPMIKCNISPNGDRIYHLPTDPFYDKVKIDPDTGEFFAQTVREAVEKGFRRARKYRDVG
jgi:hypothetical protein